MNILIIAQYFPPDFGGASTRAVNVAKALKMQGCNVVIVSAFPHYPNGDIPVKYRRKIIVEEEIERMKIIRTWVPKLAHSTNFKRVLIHFSFFLSSLFAIRKVGKTDLIFASNASFFISFPAMAYNFLLRRDYIRNVDDLWPEVWYDLGFVKSKFVKKILDFIASSSYNKSIAVTPLSEGYVNTLISKYKIPQKKITVIEQGVDTSKFIKIKSQSENKKNKIIMYSGALSLGYDFEIIFKCAKILESELIHFIIRGKGELENKLKQSIKDYKLSNVELNTEFLPEEKLISLLNSADIFILPMSPVKGFDLGLPTKILEYQAIGKPIVCVSNGEPGKYIERTNSGLVNSTRNPEDFAKLIMSLVRDKKLAEQYGNNGYNYIRLNLTLEKIGERLMRVINNHFEHKKNKH